MKGYRKALAFIMTMVIIISTNTCIFADVVSQGGNIAEDPNAVVESNKEKDPNATVDSNAETENITDSKSILAAEVLRELGILPESLGTEVNMEEPITRADATSIVVGLLGVENMGETTDTNMFSDVPEDAFSAASIKVGVDLGIVSGYSDGTFHPDDPITYEQAIKMIVTALNLQIYAQQKGGYPTGYLAIASEKGITKGVTVQFGAQVSIGAMIKMIYNAIDVDILEQTEFGENTKYSTTKGNTILSQKLDIYKYTGIMTANYFTKLTGESTLKKNQVEIDGEPYDTDISNAQDLLGYKVECYYKEDKTSDKRHILSIRPKEGDNEVVEIDSENVESYQSNVLSYWRDKEKDSDSKKVSIPTTIDIIYNGKVDIYESRDIDFIPDSGKIILLDNNNDGQYDVVFIQDYTNYFIRSVDKINYSVTDEYQNTVLELDPNDTDKKIRIYKDNSEVDFKRISQWNILSVLQSKDGKNIVAYISTDAVDGTITAAEKDYVYIDDNKYKVAPNLKNSGETISLDDTGKYYLDFMGNIAGVDFQSKTGSNIGYLIKVAQKTGGINNTFQLKILNEKGSIVFYDLADSVRLNDIPTKDKNAMDKFFKTDKIGILQTAYVQQMIRFTLNSEGKISDLQTAAARLRNLTLDFTSSERQYKNTDKTFYLNFGINDKTVIFSVPRPEDVTAGLDDDTDYSVRQMSMFVNDTKYTVEGYNADDLGYVKQLVNYTNLGNSSIVVRSPIGLVDKVTTTSVDGELHYNFYLATGGTKKAVQTVDSSRFKYINSAGTTAPFNVNTLQRGMIVQYVTNDGGNITALKILIDPNNLVAGADSGRTQDIGTITGMVYSKNTSFISVGYEKNAATGQYIFNRAGMWLFSGVRGSVSIYDRERDKIYAVKSLDEVKDYKAYGDNASIVYCRFSYGEIRDVFVFNNLNNLNRN